ncbi:MAG: tRNA pseudouridine(55) synthase TruB [Flavobacteriales bacterium]|jgi:tRNA pseudouridine55 synthase|nr:tRNA pseudouridine(55) synthase TruB [Flavobacteriales bacterium]
MEQTKYQKGEVLLVDKPLEWTSFQAVNKLKHAIRRTYGLRKIKIGHAGTLDPLATGLLIICTGKKTKTITEYQGQAKEYTGTITLGGTTPSYDLETEIDQEYPTEHITEEAIQEIADSFLGEQDQFPPIFSALKQKGEALYKKARRGEEVEVKARKITFYEVEITKISMPNIHFRVLCSKGTYIRSFAYDFGKKLKSGAHLSALRRTKIGDFSVKNAWELTELVSKIESEIE